MIKTLVFNSFQVNTYVLYDETGECVIIDPACYETSEKQVLKAFIESNKLKPSKMIFTHCHIDHVLGSAYLSSEYNLPAFIHRNDEFLWQQTVEYGSLFGLKANEPPKISGYFEDGEQIKFGDSVLKALHVPGHSPGSLAYYNQNQRFVMVGDVLFRGSIGRTDLAGGDFDTLIESITTKLFTLPAETTVYSGHGPSTSIGLEMRTNPFFK